MPKILKPYTIIPSDLYVQRDADKQVKNIISDMGRPGYVLVSRQMGKTNLLLNAKRRLESDSVFFVYIDLSNSFPSAKSCFENIVDTAIETYIEKFAEISKVIFERRLELKDTPPHKQHTNELRLLLKALDGGKMIIILDEIDALTKTDYSDQIFSQIRSSYFASRVNYKEFYNLTYLLSGVVEPNEIIKDPKISPFNIGQKIYLNDFLREEFEAFLTLSNLDLTEDVIDRIFYWTNGNPRMTWDVCSEVENRLKNLPISSEIIDKIVSELYLTTFDRPPIDNIREIVKNDREIRNSIVEIEFKKGKEVSAKVKSKLYLAGIINYEEDEIHIKNEIIRLSLSYDWIRALEEEDKGLINIAVEEYKNLKYFESLSTFEKYLKNNDFGESQDKPHYYYIMGHCAYSLQNFEKAIEYFDKADFDIEDEALWHFKLLSQKGLTFYYLNKFEDSLECFKKVIANGKKDVIYAKALLNYGSIALKSDNIKHKDEAVNIFNEIINETAFKKEKLKEPFINELKSIAYYNLAQTYNLSDDALKSTENYQKALSFGEAITKPKIILALLEITKDSEHKKQLLDQLIELIINGTIKPKEEDPERPMDFNFDELRTIAILSFLDFRETLFTKIEPYLSLLGDKSLLKHLYDLVIFSVRANLDWKQTMKLLNETYEFINKPEYEADKEEKYYLLKLLAYFSDVRTSQAKQIEYISMFEKERLDTVDYMDMEIFTNTIFALSEKKKYQEALRYAKLINSFRETVAESDLINFLVIYHLELNLLFKHVNDRNLAIRKAEDIISLANDVRVAKQKSNLVSDDSVEIIRQNAESVLRPIVKNTIPIRVEKTFRRNEVVKVRYKDGTILEAKYKKVEKDIELGSCFILN
jgi:tetratricopeptide (TPR) repeat protein